MMHGSINIAVSVVSFMLYTLFTYLVKRTAIVSDVKSSTVISKFLYVV